MEYFGRQRLILSGVGSVRVQTQPAGCRAFLLESRKTIALVEPVSRSGLALESSIFQAFGAVAFTACIVTKWDSGSSFATQLISPNECQPMEDPGQASTRNGS